MSKRWKMLDRLVRDGGSPLAMSPSSYAELATRVYEAVSASDPSELRDLVAQLEETIDAGRAKAPVSARAAADGRKEAGTAETSAYALGQLGFAYRVLANAMNHRADRGFEERLRTGTLAPYVDALARSEMTGAELAKSIGSRPETVSRNLKELRSIGAADFRRDGTSLINFLTPAAKLLAGTTDRGRKHIAEPVRLWVGEKTHEQDPFMRDVPSFEKAEEPV